MYLIYNPPHETFAEKLSLSALMVLKGMGTVFLVLILLWGIIELFGVFATGSDKSKHTAKSGKAEKPANTVEVKKESAPVSVSSDSGQNIAESDDGAIVAAIIGAIEAYRASEGSSSLPYRVVSFKRKDR